MTGCVRPLDDAALADYWVGALGPDAESEVEEHLLGCGACSRRLERLAALADAIRAVARQGRARFVVTREFLDHLATQGLRIRSYSPPPGGGVQCTVLPEDDVLVARLSAELAGARRVDLVQCDAAGAELRRLADVPFDARAGEILTCEPIAFVRELPSHRMRMKLVAVDEGSERVLAEYTFDHTAASG